MLLYLPCIPPLMGIQGIFLYIVRFQRAEKRKSLSYPAIPAAEFFAKPTENSSLAMDRGKKV